MMRRKIFPHKIKQYLLIFDYRKNTWEGSDRTRNENKQIKKTNLRNNN